MQLRFINLQRDLGGLSDCLKPNTHLPFNPILTAELERTWVLSWKLSGPKHSHMHLHAETSEPLPRQVYPSSASWVCVKQMFIWEDDNLSKPVALSAQLDVRHQWKHHFFAYVGVRTINLVSQKLVQTSGLENQLVLWTNIKSFVYNQTVFQRRVRIRENSGFSC